MEFALGILSAIGIAGLARLTGFDRDRSFYPTLMMVIASYYVLFAAQTGDMRAIAAEMATATFFFAGALWGHRRSLWIVSGLLLAHGIFDFLTVHPGAPIWWPGYCAAIDVVLAGVLALLLRQGPLEPS